MIIVIKPDWKGAFNSNNDKVEVVETHIIANGGFGFACKEAHDAWLATEHPGYMTSLTRLVVLKYKKTNEMVSFLMIIVGDKEYLKKKEFKMWGNTYLVKDKDFNGLVLYHSLEGAFVNGWRFEKGKVSHTVTLNFNEDFGVNLKSTTTTCYEEPIWETTNYYKDWYLNGEFDRTQYLGSTTDVVGYATICVEEDDGNNQDSGGGGPYNPSDTDSPKVIEYPTFIGTEADCAKTSLEKGSILNNLLAGFNLSTSLIDVTYKVGYLTGANGNCSFNEPDEKMEITINTDRLSAPAIELARTILHESFHAYLFGKVYKDEIHNGLAPEPNFEVDMIKYKEKFGTPDWQHNYMADKYLSYMKQGLSDFFDNEPYKDKFLDYVEGSDSWYGTDFLFESLAWGGLQKTDAWATFYGNATNKTKYDNTRRYIVNLIPKEDCK